MARWEPDAKGRLAEAALELYSERGYEQTTVAEIAERAGVTERTFFRHYADKREVLFPPLMLETVGEALARTPPQTTAMELATRAIEAAAALLTNERRPRARRRQALLDANPALQERELLKMHALVTAIGGELERRGVPAVEASLAGETVVAAFKVAFTVWVAGDDDRTLVDELHAALTTLRAVATG